MVRPCFPGKIPDSFLLPCCESKATRGPLEEDALALSAFAVELEPHLNERELWGIAAFAVSVSADKCGLGEKRLPALRHRAGQTVFPTLGSVPGT